MGCRPAVFVAFRLGKGEKPPETPGGEIQGESAQGHALAPVDIVGVSSDSRRRAIRPDLTRSTIP